MPSLNALRLKVGLNPQTPGPQTPDAHFTTLEEARRLLSAAPPALVSEAALALIAREALSELPGVTELLAALGDAVQSARPERELTRLLALVTGAYAEIRSSWGDLIAHAGTPAGALMEQRLVYEGRHVGSLALSAPPEWRPLLALAAPFARLARLQSAAAAAALRRVGERVLEALLAGDSVDAPDSEPCTMGALTFAAPAPRSERAREARVQALDVLCAVGEGYFRERGLRCLTTVRGDRALWLWHSHDPEREARELHAALLASTGADFRLGVSARHGGYAGARDAYRQAVQSLGEARETRTLVTFLRSDPLQALLGSDALTPLRDQIRARLAVIDGDGRIEGTLRAFLRHPGTSVELAESLNIHVNTLRYRLRRAEEALGQSLSEPAVVARLYLALSAEPQLPGRAT